MDIYDYNYDVTEPNYIDFNITKLRSNGHVIYLNVLRDNIDLHVTISINYENAKNEFTTEFVNKTISLCRLIHDRRYEPFLRLFYLILKEFSPEYISKCPIEKVYVWRYFETTINFWLQSFTGSRLEIILHSIG